MFTKSVTIFRLLGFDIKVDMTWLILAVLITWSLATGFFPVQMPDLKPYIYWVLGVEGAVGVFLSIVLHELGHALVARYYGIRIKDITLFIFGGVASMESEPERPRDEFLMAIAGPLTSGALSVVFLGLDFVVRGISADAPVLGVLGYLAWLNAILALFNMIPAFPLDGGRVLRAVLWDWKKDLRFATRVSSGLGSLFGLGLIFLGVFSFVNGNFIGGIWFFMIGMFVRSASSMSYKQLLLRKAFEGEPVRKFMKTDVVSVQPGTTVRALVEDYVYRFHHKMFPVIYGDVLRGCVTTREVKAVPREHWDETSVGEIAQACGPENCVSPEMDAMDALALMGRTGRGGLLVVEGNRLLGVVSLKDLMDFLNLKLDLESNAR